MRIHDENDLERLRQKALLLEAENDRLVSKVVSLEKKLVSLEGASPEALQQRLAQLEEQLQQTRDRLFGDKSEKRPKAKGAKEKTKQTGHGPREQKQLEVVPKLHELDVADKTCPQCGKSLSKWEGQFEESEEIDVVQRRFVLVKHQRQKYRCECNACIETAPAPPKLIPGGRYSLDFAIEVVTAKYLDHMPLERQVRVMAREGLVTDSQTLWDQSNALARLVDPAHEALHEYLLRRAVVGIDESYWRLMGAKGQDEGENKRWQMWALAGTDAVCYRLHDSRSTDAASKVLRGYAGTVMADGYGAYRSLQQRGGRFRLVHCWDHVRRKFDEAESFFPEECGRALELIGEIYAVEREAQGPPEEIAKLRREKSKPVLDQLFAWATETRARSLPQSGLGKAIAYMLELWSGLVAYVDDGRIPISNAFTERALRGPVVGRKNHYGSRSERGTQVAALFYSLLESAKLCGLEPKAYLRTAALAALAGERILLPHEVAALADRT